MTDLTIWVCGRSRFSFDRPFPAEGDLKRLSFVDVTSGEAITSGIMRSPLEGLTTRTPKGVALTVRPDNLYCDTHGQLKKAGLANEY